MTKVLDGQFSDQIDRLIIVDSRYPYEFEGGHIKTARNIYTKEKLVEVFLEKRNEMAHQNKRVVVIFHCEFSSERGPSMLRFLRNQDRALNRDFYPKLFYPELYLLEGGYKAFYESHKSYCDPIDYKPMLHQDHVHDLKHFRAKTKTWESQHKHQSSFASAFKLANLNTSITGSSNKTKRQAGNASRLGMVSKMQRFPRSTLF
jgi:hypothetical protein